MARTSSRTVARFKGWEICAKSVCPTGPGELKRGNRSDEEGGRDQAAGRGRPNGTTAGELWSCPGFQDVLSLGTYSLVQ